MAGLVDPSTMLPGDALQARTQALPVATAGAAPALAMPRVAVPVGVPPAPAPAAPAASSQPITLSGGLQTLFGPAGTQAARDAGTDFGQGDYARAAGDAVRGVGLGIGRIAAAPIVGGYNLASAAVDHAVNLVGGFAGGIFGSRGGAAPAAPAAAPAAAPGVATGAQMFGAPAAPLAAPAVPAAAVPQGRGLIPIHVADVQPAAPAAPAAPALTDTDKALGLGNAAEAAIYHTAPLGQRAAVLGQLMAARTARTTEAMREQVRDQYLADAKAGVAGKDMSAQQLYTARVLSLLNSGGLTAQSVNNVLNPGQQ